MTVHDCPHCECDECAFCGKHLEDATHSIAWDYFEPPRAYSKKRGHQRDEQVDMCNTCARKIAHVLSMLQGDEYAMTAEGVAGAAHHPKLRDDDS